MNSLGKFNCLPKDVFCLILNYICHPSTSYHKRINTKSYRIPYIQNIKQLGLVPILTISKGVYKVIQYYISTDPKIYNRHKSLVKIHQRFIKTSKIFEKRQMKLDELKEIILDKIYKLESEKITDKWNNFFKLKRNTELMRLLTRNFVDYVPTRVTKDGYFLGGTMHKRGRPKEELENYIMRHKPYRFIIQIRKNWIIFRIKIRVNWY